MNDDFSFNLNSFHNNCPPYSTNTAENAGKVAHMHDNIAVRTSYVVRMGEQRVNLLKSFASVNQFSAFVCSNNRFNFSCNIGSRKSEMLEQNIAGSRSSKAFH